MVFRYYYILIGGDDQNNTDVDIYVFRDPFFSKTNTHHFHIVLILLDHPLVFVYLIYLDHE